MKEFEIGYLIYDEYDDSIEDINLTNLSIAVVPTTCGYLGEVELVRGKEVIIGREAVKNFLETFRRA